LPTARSLNAVPPRPSRIADTRARTAAAAIYDAVREDIVGMRMVPGEPVSEKALALKHGVSRTPVREALLRLASEQLIAIFPQSGTFVSRIPIRALPEAILVRKALEELTAAQCAQAATAGQVAALKTAIDRQRKLARSGNRVQFHEADDGFHAAIADAAGFQSTWRLILQVKVQVDRYRLLTLPVPGRMTRVVSEHAAVVDAIAAHDPARAAAAMAAHLDGLSGSIRDVRDLNPAYFDLDADDEWKTS
jgi:DNA-binding GntR family transcriptional regulator